MPKRIQTRFPFADMAFQAPDYVQDFGHNPSTGRITSNRYITVRFEPYAASRRVRSLVRDLERRGIRLRGVSAGHRLMQFECFRASDRATWQALNSVVEWLNGGGKGVVASAVLEMLFI